MDFIDRTLDGLEFAREREATIVQQARDRVIGRLTAMLANATPEQATLGMARARAIQERYLPESLDSALGAITAHGAHWRMNVQRLASLFEHDKAIGQATRTTSGRWTARPSSLISARHGAGTACCHSGSTVTGCCGDCLRTSRPCCRLTSWMSRHTAEFELTLGLRSTAESITCPQSSPSRRRSRRARMATSGSRRAVGSASTETLAGGHPLGLGSWEVHVYTHWMGVARRGRLVIQGDPVGIRVHERRVLSAYRDAKERLSIGVDDPGRPLVLDAGTRFASASGTVTAFTAPVPRLFADGPFSRGVELVLTPIASRSASSAVVVPGVVEADASGGTLRAGGDVAPGAYLSLLARPSVTPMRGIRPRSRLTAPCISRSQRCPRRSSTRHPQGCHRCKGVRVRSRSGVIECTFADRVGQSCTAGTKRPCRRCASSFVARYPCCTSRSRVKISLSLKRTV